MSGRTFTREFKLDVCRQIAAGEKRPAQVCREHDLGETVLFRWRREYESRGESAFAPKNTLDPCGSQSLELRIAELERLCGQLSLENALLKKAFEQTQQVQRSQQTQQTRKRPRALSASAASPSGNGKP